MSDPLWRGLNPPYRTLVVDPPWAYRTKTGITTRTSHRTACAEGHYSTMTNAEILALPVADLADDDAFLFLWVTNPKIFGDRRRGREAPGPGACDILEAWGFRYQTLITWDKQGALGLGFYFRGMTEHVLFGTRGKARIPTKRRQRNIFKAQKRRHSQKPDAFFGIVEAACDGPYLELFARQRRPGWDAWGNELPPPTTL